MKITIFGASGGTGKQLIKQALEAGNEVTAFARNPSKLNTRHEHLTIVQGMSDLDWTIVRVSMLNNNPKSGKVKVGYLGKGEVGTRISRADMADFMLKQVQNTKYLRKAPVISN